MKRLAAIAAMAAAISVFAPASSYGLAGDYAKGSGWTGGIKFSFLAQGTGLGDRADGSWVDTLTNTDRNITIKGDITCMIIVGRDAFMGGRITSYKPAGAAGLFGFSQGFYLFAEDNAKPSNGFDRYSRIFLPTPPPDCTGATTAFGFSSPVVTGDIEIVPGLP